jgi:DNA-directed RNA polymerase subunit L
MLRDEIKKKSFNKKAYKTKHIIIKRIKIKFDIKIKRDKISRDAIQKQIQ